MSLEMGYVRALEFFVVQRRSVVARVSVTLLMVALVLFRFLLRLAQLLRLARLDELRRFRRFLMHFSERRLLLFPAIPRPTARFYQTELRQRIRITTRVIGLGSS